MTDDQDFRADSGRGSADSLRLQVYLARSGVASRRNAEKLIAAGRVAVNGELVTRMGVKVARDDDVRVDGRSVTPEARLRYLALHKPIHVISSAADERGRPMVTDYVPEEFEERLFPVGRLDFETSGLILLTNDGRFARVVLHPSFEIEKEYQVQCRTDIPANLAERFEAGIRDDEGVRYKARSVHCLDRRHARVVLTEGKNREIRRVFSILGADIEELVRVRIGPIRLGGLRPGGTRSLRDREIQWFFRQEKLLQREGVREGGSRH